MSSASASTLMIVADEVEKTMHREMGEMMKKNPVLVGAFALERLVGNDDIAEQFSGDGAGRMRRRKRQHVGRLVDAAPLAIERTNRLIVGQHDTHFAVRC